MKTHFFFIIGLSILLTSTAFADDFHINFNNQIESQVYKNIEHKKNIKKIKYDILTDKIITLQSEIESNSERVSQLAGQLTNIDSQISLTKEKVRNINELIAGHKNEIIVLTKSILDLEDKLIVLKSYYQKYLKNLYSEFLLIDNEDSIEASIIGGVNIFESIKDQFYLHLLSNARGLIILETKNAINDLNKLSKKFNEEEERYLKLEKLLSLEKNNLDIQKQAKTTLLQETLGKQAIFEQLLAESIEQEEGLKQDLRNIEVNLKSIQAKIRSEKQKVKNGEYKQLLADYDSIKATDFYDENNNLIFDWPVEPIYGISAYFKDSGYQNRFKRVHNAIDIPVPQNTIINAPASAVVYKVRENGLGYSYIILAHEQEYLSVYGHITKPLVFEGETIFRGQPIALSGGMPGTIGAGLLTTGPHVHFEIIKEGKHVDPLIYLEESELF